MVSGEDHIPTIRQHTILVLTMGECTINIRPMGADIRMTFMEVATILRAVVCIGEAETIILMEESPIKEAGATIDKKIITEICLTI